MVPWIVTMIPQYVIFYRLHLINTPWPWVLWGIQGTPLQIFLFRQFYATFPRELEDAAAIDGSGRLRIFFDIFVPNSKPVIAIAAVWAFILVWGDYLTQDLFYLIDPNGTLLTRITGCSMSTSPAGDSPACRSPSTRFPRSSSSSRAALHHADRRDDDRDQGVAHVVPARATAAIARRRRVLRFRVAVVRRVRPLLRGAARGQPLMSMATSISTD